MPSNTLTIKHIPSVPLSLIKQYFSTFYPCTVSQSTNKTTITYKTAQHALYTRKVLTNTALNNHTITFILKSKARVYVRECDEKMAYDRASKYGECVVGRKGQGCIVTFERFKNADEFVESGGGEYAFKNGDERWGSVSDREEEEMSDDMAVMID
ncbi:hypothetical protein THOM_1185 [Trachipleistophora hominis]|uniref:Uncharacterized protein n=1 Tax=Trachipleistophora hominis TaxID=72359 RepID=L7JYN7_TRAHO|nr:hypothetical protein THOM_1185 [Trachipleistophora hominis]